MRLSLPLLLCCIAVARGMSNFGGDDSGMEDADDRSFFLESSADKAEEGSGWYDDITSVTPVIATQAGNAALIFTTNSKHWAATANTTNSTFEHSVYLTLDACANYTDVAQIATNNSTGSVSVSDLISEEFEVAGLDAGCYNLCYSRNNSYNWVPTGLPVVVVDIHDISPDVVNDLQNEVVFNIEGIVNKDNITFTSGNCSDIVTPFASSTSTGAFNVKKDGEIADGDFTGGAMPGVYSLCFSLGGTEDYIDTGLNITIIASYISIGELFMSATEKLQTITVVNDGVASVGDSIYLTTGECAPGGSTTPATDTLETNLTSSSGLQSAAFDNSHLSIIAPTEMKLCFSPDSDSNFYDTLYTVTAYPTRVMTVEPMEIDTNDDDLVMEFTLISTLGADMVYFTRGAGCDAAIGSVNATAEHTDSIALNSNGEGRMDWSVESPGDYKVCFSSGTDAWVYTSIILSHEVVSLDSIIVDISPTLVTADMDFNVTLYGELSDTMDKFVFALDCDNAVTTVLSSAGENITMSTETVNLPAGDYKLCYLESGYSNDPIEQTNITLNVMTTSPGVIVGVDPMWVSAGVKTSLQLFGSPVDGDLLFFSSKCSEVWKEEFEIDAKYAEIDLLTGQGGKLDLCYRSVGLEDSVVQTGVTLNVVAIASISATLVTPSLVNYSMTLENNGEHGVNDTIYFTSNECMATAPAANATNTVEYSVVYVNSASPKITVDWSVVDPGDFTLCFSPTGGNGYLETALEIELAKTDLASIEPEYSSVTLNQMYTVVLGSGVTVSTEQIYLTTGECSVTSADPTVDVNTTDTTAPVALAVAIDFSTVVIKVETNLIVCFKSVSGIWADSGLTVTVFPSPIEEVRPEESTTDDVELKFELGVITNPLAVSIDTDEIYLTMVDCFLGFGSPMANSSYNPTPSETTSAVWSNSTIDMSSLTVSGEYSVCWREADGEWFETGLAVKHTVVTSPTYITAVSPTVITGAVGVTISYTGAMGNETEFALWVLDTGGGDECDGLDPATNSGAVAIDENGMAITTLAAGDYVLCYYSAGDTFDSVMQTGITLSVEVTAADAVTGVSPVFMLAGSESLTLSGISLTGMSSWALQGDACDVLTTTDTNAEGVLTASLAAGVYNLCYQDEGLEDSIAQTGVQLVVIEFRFVEPAGIPIGSLLLTVDVNVTDATSNDLFVLTKDVACLNLNVTLDENNAMTQTPAKAPGSALDFSALETGMYNVCYNYDGLGWIDSGLTFSFFSSGLVMISPAIIFNDVVDQILVLTDSTISANTTYKIAKSSCSGPGIEYTPSIDDFDDIIIIDTVAIFEAVAQLGSFKVCVSLDSGASYTDSGIVLELVAPTMSPTPAGTGSSTGAASATTASSSSTGVASATTASSSSTGVASAPTASAPTASAPTVSPTTSAPGAPTSAPTSADVVFSAASRVTQKSLLAMVTIVFGVLLL